MIILPQKIEKIFMKNLYTEVFSRKSSVLELDDSPSINNYISILSNIDKKIALIAPKLLQSIFDDIDEKYRNSLTRKSKYHIKSYPKRTFLTVFGPLTITRTYYQLKNKKGCFCYLDRYLKLKKYDYYDPFIKASIVQASTHQSFSKAGKEVWNNIGPKVLMHEKPIPIPRQTVRNIILHNTLSSMREQKKNYTPSTIFVMLDEKFVHTQNNDNKDVMVKHAIVFTGIERVKGHTGRYKLLNKHGITSTKGSSIHDDVLDYIYKVYDTDKIKNIYVLGDGAGWIKSAKYEYNVNGIKSHFALDKYHFKQALHHIFLDSDKENEALGYILSNNKKAFTKMCKSLTIESPHRKETIIAKRDYILNNICAINLTYHDNLSCCMEGQISHNIADLFTSRPKGYSTNMIEKLLNIRMKYKNGHNIKMLFLSNFNIKEEIIIDKENYDYSLFDKLSEKSDVTLPKTPAIVLKQKRLKA